MCLLLSGSGSCIGLGLLRVWRLLPSLESTCSRVLLHTLPLLKLLRQIFSLHAIHRLPRLLLSLGSNFIFAFRVADSVCLFHRHSSGYYTDFSAVTHRTRNFRKAFLAPRSMFSHVSLPSSTNSLIFPVTSPVLLISLVFSSVPSAISNSTSSATAEISSVRPLTHRFSPEPKDTYQQSTALESPPANNPLQKLLIALQRQCLARRDTKFH